MSDYTPTNAPAQVTELMLAGMTGKSKLPVVKMFLLGILAGAFIAFGAEASSLAAHNVTQVGIQRLIMGCVFPVGLIMLVIIASFFKDAERYLREERAKAPAPQCNETGEGEKKAKQEVHA